MFHSFKKKRLLFFVIPILSGLIFYLFPLTVPEIQAQTSTTTLSVVITLCGNNTVEVGEDCDGTDLDGKNCATFGYIGGSLSCKADCTFDVSGCGISFPGWAEPVKETKVVLRGKAYPNALITLLIDSEAVVVVEADSQANFNIELTTLTAGIYNFGLRAKDEKGRESITFSFSVTVSHRMTTTVGGIFFPPTIELESNILNLGDTLNISGQTAPWSEINIQIESLERMILKKTEADDNGNWDYSFDTSELEEGSYLVKANSISTEDFISGFSNILKFILGEEIIEELCPGADLNKDGRVDLVDFSILLYWWKTDDSCSDQNQDGIVDLQDFSIMMYYWTG